MLSREDAETATILITTNAWSMFSPPLEGSAVRVDRSSCLTTIVPEDSCCVLPPHQHRHRQAGQFAHRLNFHARDVIEIRTLGDHATSGDG